MKARCPRCGSELRGEWPPGAGRRDKGTAKCKGETCTWEGKVWSNGTWFSVATIAGRYLGSL